MRHKFGYRKLNRTSEHRKALFKNMLNSLIKYEQITTTLPKAKELKPKIDKVITLGKKNSLSSKKNLFGYQIQKNTLAQKKGNNIAINADREVIFHKNVRINSRQQEVIKNFTIQNILDSTN